MSEPTYAQTVTRLARDYRIALAKGPVSKPVRTAMLDQLFTAAGAVGISVPDAVDDLFEEIWAD